VSSSSSKSDDRLLAGDDVVVAEGRLSSPKIESKEAFFVAVEGADFVVITGKSASSPKKFEDLGVGVEGAFDSPTKSNKSDAGFFTCGAGSASTISVSNVVVA